MDLSTIDREFRRLEAKRKKELESGVHLDEVTVTSISLDVVRTYRRKIKNRHDINRQVDYFECHKGMTDVQKAQMELVKRRLMAPFN